MVMVQGFYKMQNFTVEKSHKHNFFEVPPSHLAEAVPLYIMNALQRGADELGLSWHSMVDTLSWVYVLGISRTSSTAVTQKSLIEHREGTKLPPTDFYGRPCMRLISTRLTVFPLHGTDKSGSYGREITNSQARMAEKLLMMGADWTGLFYFRARLIHNSV